MSRCLQQGRHEIKDILWVVQKLCVVWSRVAAKMKEQKELKSGETSRFSQHNLAPYINEKWENPVCSKALKLSTKERKKYSSNNNHPLASSNSPARAIEFLCRPWSSSSSDFQQMFSTSNLLLPRNNIDGIVEAEKERNEAKSIQNHAMNGRCISNEVDKKWMDFRPMKGWLKGKSLARMFTSNREKKREEIRLHSAKLHAALSLTQLAAAIAGFAANSKSEAQNQKQIFVSRNNSQWDQETGVAAASAAALLTTVFAEAAESLGAKRPRVASAVKSGLATQTPIDMMTLTATAATCLRGAATLNSRAKAEAYFPRNQELLRAGAQISVLTPSGDEELRWVTINVKQRQLTLSIRKKYLGGALTASREYKVIDVMEDMKGGKFVGLKTNKGIMKLIFYDEKQSTIWVSTICKLLEMHNS